MAGLDPGKSCRHKRIKKPLEKILPLDHAAHHDILDFYNSSAVAEVFKGHMTAMVTRKNTVVGI